MKELQQIQCELKAPKGQFNSFGKYAYRSCEDICEAVKPLLAKFGCTLTLSDEITIAGDFTYVKATATLKNATGEMEVVSAFARHPKEKKGMDDSQITGATSSYARKYALNGLFCIDDTKDTDSTATEQPGHFQQPQAKPQPQQKQPVPPKQQPVQQKQEKTVALPPVNQGNNELVTDVQRKQLYNIGKSRGLTTDEMGFVVFETVGVNSSADIPANRFDEVCDAMNKAVAGQVM